MLLQVSDNEFSQFADSLFEGGELQADIVPNYSQLSRITRKDIEGKIKDAIALVYKGFQSGVDTTVNISKDVQIFLSDFVNDNLSALHSMLCAPAVEGQDRGIISKDSVGNTVAIAQMAILIQMVADTFSTTFTECFVVAVLTIIFIRNTFGAQFCE